MDVHNNARTTRHSGMLVVKRLTQGWTVAAVASAQDVTPKTVRKWRDRFAAEGACGVADRTSRPRRSPRRLSKEQQEAIVALRRERLTGPVYRPPAARPGFDGWVGTAPRGTGPPRRSLITVSNIVGPPHRLHSTACSHPGVTMRLSPRSTTLHPVGYSDILVWI
jgi:hypothetical protein